MNTVMFHIGLPKTGTTYLQQCVFPKICHSVNGMYEPFGKIFQGSGKIIISDESMSGNPLNGNWREEMTSNMRMIKDVFGDVKIIVGYRKPSDWIKSIYKQYLHQGGTMSFSKFITKTFTYGDPIRTQTHYNIIKEYFNNIFVYQYEKLNIDMIIEIMKFINIYDNQAMNFEDKECNKGIQTNYQKVLLRNVNKLNYKNILYNKYFSHFKLTPRFIIKSLPNIGSKFDVKMEWGHKKTFELHDFHYNEFINKILTYE